MTDIRFYHLERQSLEEILPSLLTKALGSGHKIVVRTDNEKDAERLNAHLWTYGAESFLPHGTKKDGKPEDQPIWITDKDENPNEATVLILTNGTSTENMDSYTLCCEMLDGHDPAAVSNARSKWKTYKDAGHDVTYWQQSHNGWEKK